MKKILFTHTDLDGAGCAVIFLLAHNFMMNEAHVVHCSNAEVNAKVQQAWDTGLLDECESICFGDICPGEQMIWKLYAAFPNKISIWDHHWTNHYISDIVPTAIIKPERENGQLESGTSLMFQHYCRNSKGGVPGLSCFTDAESYFGFDLLCEFVDTIRSYDTYEWKQTGNTTAKELQTLFHLIGMKKFVNKYYDKFINCSIGGEPLIDENDLVFVRSKIEQEQRVIDSITIDDVYVMHIKGYTCAVKFSSGGMNVSDFSHQFLGKYPHLDVLININMAGSIEYRTRRHDINTGEIFAKMIEGGGGHPRASGSPIPEEKIKESIKSVMNLIDLDSEFCIYPTSS